MKNYNQKHVYRLNSYDNYSERKGYYVLTKGKYKIEYATISFRSMYNYIKKIGLDFDDIHLNNITFKDLFNYMSFEDEKEKL